MSFNGWYWPVFEYDSCGRTGSMWASCGGAAILVTRLLELQMSAVRLLAAAPGCDCGILVMSVLLAWDFLKASALS